MKLRKVMIIGVGNVGSTSAYALVNRGICEEIALVDLNKERVQGHAQDLMDAASYRPNKVNITVRDLSDCADIDIAIITATTSLTKVTREEELAGTSKIINNIVPQMMQNGFNGIFLVATNPCDAITYQVWKLSGLPRNKVLGTGVWLDTTRLRRLLADELNIGPQSIDAFIVGEHGNSQFPVWSHSSVYGVKLNQYNPHQLDFQRLADKARTMGIDILQQKGCTEFGIGSTIAEICQNIFTNSHRALALSCILDGEYGQRDLAIGVPAIITQQGVQQIIELNFTEQEQALFKHSADVIKGYISQIQLPN